jgi:ATP-dependent RNA helicase DDX3X
MSFDTGEMAKAMGEVANRANGNGSGPVKDPEAFKLARQHGWIEPSAYNYPSASDKIADKQPTNEPSNSEYKAPQWAHEAVKYEWKEEYGDVGPKIPELEEQLFHNELIMRKGNMFDE